MEVVYSPAARPLGAAVRVAAVYPSAEVLPENQLKLYLHFSGPMSRGEAYRHLRLVDDSGRVVDRPFLEIGEELWDASGPQADPAFRPGAEIKRGLVPREEEGPILVEGKAYTFVVGAGWPDADGRPLVEGFRKAIPRRGPRMSAGPTPSRWSIAAGPIGNSRGGSSSDSPEPLDHAMLGRAIAVEARGTTIAGRIAVGPGETSWRFTPESPWPAGPVALRVDTELEDLAGKQHRSRVRGRYRPRPRRGTHAGSDHHPRADGALKAASSRRGRIDQTSSSAAAVPRIFSADFTSFSMAKGFRM